MLVDMLPEQVSFMWALTGLVSGLVFWLIVTRF
jgi:hypothetical protein